ncbi:MAG: mannose-6-phosphate isomerase, class I [Lentilactobacillus diolivorans]|nr:mannose-6-phosphate isomerase, class I [Lentilactobacillus diolivorans]MCH4165273.1 mannose-6-phosphate isomerase, class I [Lentilactobacillus diolivorans]MDH5105933.1 mannose-6-phosphate isomerase, class I [Lentilactobacillus diolivorans]GEP24979.1 mannose-6-phosphate isomerase, class I [Lentilactobacillus diolivorans]
MVAAAPLFLKAALHEKMWGGTKLREYGFKLPSERTGEAWIVSAHPHGPSTVTNGQFAGQTLGSVWQNHPELFGGHPVDEAFPLLVKILDANRDLSIQVHPDDQYAKLHGEKYGKTESWYILSATSDAKLYYGHTAKTEQELRDAVTSGHIDRILRTVPVKAGDFYYVPSGTLHALGTGIVALETQQSSDLTFRFYDFDRVDPATGKKRELQVKDALAVTNVPHRDPQIKQEVTRIAHATMTQLVNATYFAVEKVVVNGAAVLTQEHRYLIQTVVAGQGSLTVNQRQYRLTKGMSYILPNQIQDYELNGQMTLIESWAK